MQCDICEDTDTIIDSSLQTVKNAIMHITDGPVSQGTYKCDVSYTIISGTTDEYGICSFDYDEDLIPDDYICKFVCTGGTDSITDENVDMEIVRFFDKNSLLTNEYLFVSPITTITANIYENDSTSSLNEVENHLCNVLNITKDDMNKDFIEEQDISMSTLNTKIINIVNSVTSDTSSTSDEVYEQIARNLQNENDTIDLNDKDHVASLLSGDDISNISDNVIDFVIQVNAKTDELVNNYSDNFEILIETATQYNQAVKNMVSDNNLDESKLEEIAEEIPVNPVLEIRNNRKQ